MKRDTSIEKARAFQKCRPLLASASRMILTQHPEQKCFILKNFSVLKKKRKKIEGLMKAEGNEASLILYFFFLIFPLLFVGPAIC